MTVRNELFHKTTDIPGEVLEERFMQRLGKDLIRYRTLFILLIPATVVFIMFSYVPMSGLVIAFQDYRVTRGITGSQWVWFKHFVSFFTSPNAYKIIRNTLLLNVYNTIFGFPVPIIFAVALCEVRSTRFRKVVQSISYLPYFISAVVVAGLVNMLLSVDGGLFNTVRGWFGAKPINFLIEKE